MKNSFTRGSFRILTYKEKDQEIYYATALELNLTVSAEDETVALFELFEQIHEYKQTVISIGDKSLLNQEVDPDLEQAWQYLHTGNNLNQEITSPYMPLSAVTRANI